ncbi:hypothetical protein STEG23_009073 [Scotinomys teguina]
MCEESLPVQTHGLPSVLYRKSQEFTHSKESDYVIQGELLINPSLRIFNILARIYLRTRCLFCEAAAEETPALAMANEKPKEGVKTENNDHINLKVVGQDGSVVQFKIKRHTPLSKLTKAYCEQQGLSMRQIRFRFDGQPVNEADTPAQLEMEDEDMLCVFQQQTGGV